MILKRITVTFQYHATASQEQYCDFKTSTNDSNNLQLTNNPLLLQQGNFSTRYYFCSENKEKTFNLFKLFPITLNISKKEDN